MSARLTTSICALLAAAALVAAGPGSAGAAGRPADTKAEHASKKKKKPRCRATRRRAHGKAARRKRCPRRRQLKRRPTTKRPTARRPAAPSPGDSPRSAPPRPATPTVPAPKPPEVPWRRAFATNSVWNAPLPADAPLDLDSPRLSTALFQEVWLEFTRQKDVVGPWINTDAYSSPVYRVDENTPRVSVTLDTNVPELQRDFESVPIPDGARPAEGVDRSLTIYEPGADTLWEFWIAYRGADGWHARWGGKMTNVSQSPGYFPNPFGATATSLPLLGGLITIDELEAGRIDHALALAIPNTAADEVTWPAQRGDGQHTGTSAIPEGTHFRIDPSVDLSQLDLTPVGRAIAEAAQRYGMIVRDTSSCVAFYAEDPVTKAENPYPALFRGEYPDAVLRNFPWDRLQVVAPRGG